ncbi:MAG: hypothetical protein Q9191_003809 [Dirinaria sp. TL-2023a]
MTTNSVDLDLDITRPGKCELEAFEVELVMLDVGKLDAYGFGVALVRQTRLMFAHRCLYIPLRPPYDFGLGAHYVTQPSFGRGEASAKHYWDRFKLNPLQNPLHTRSFRKLLRYHKSPNKVFKSNFFSRATMAFAARSRLLPLARQARLFSSSPLRASVIDSAKESVKKADRTVSDAAVKGIEKGEQASQKAKSTIGLKTGETKGTAAEVTGEAKGKAQELAGEAKGKASEVAGEAKGKTEEVKSKI